MEKTRPLDCENGYYVEIGKRMQVKRIETDGYTFYKVICKRYSDDTAEKTISFCDKNGKHADIPDGAWVIPKAIREHWFYAKNDPHHYRPIWTVKIMDWEVEDYNEILKEKAVSEFQDNMEKSALNYNELPF